MKYTFNVPRAAIESTRRAIQSPAFQEALNLRELVGYLGADRHAAVETAPALLLTDLSVSSAGAAVAALEPLGTLEGRIVARLHDRLDPDEYVMTLARDRFTGRPVGVDFALASDVTRAAVRRALNGAFDDAKDIAQALVDEPSDPLDVPKRQQDDGMIGRELIERVRAQERQEAEALAEARDVAERTRRMGGGDPSMSVSRL